MEFGTSPNESTDESPDTLRDESAHHVLSLTRIDKTRCLDLTNEMQKNSKIFNASN